MAELPTDTVNAAEIADYYVRSAVGHYDTLRTHGECRCDARNAAINYLRRKSRWGHAFAAGAFDAALLERDQSNQV